MEDLLIINNAFVECFTLCKESEVSANIERARKYYEDDKSTLESHLVNYPNMADHWQTQLDRTKKILVSGFRSVTWDEYKELQREKWLSKEPKEITQKEFDYALNVLPPKCWIQNERFSMFFIGECTTMTYYSQYLYDKASGKYYTALTDICDESTWLDKMLNLS
jgi:hypothetical protein